MKQRIPFAFLIFIFVVLTVEVWVRSMAGKQFLLQWAEYARRQDWFAELRTQSSREEKRAEKGSPSDVCVVGTSSTTSFMQKTRALQESSGVVFYDLSNTLCGGENLLLMLAKTSHLPQKNILFCVSELSWSQPFDAGAFCDLMSLRIFPSLLQLSFVNAQIRAHPLYPLLLKGVCYDLLQTARYARDFSFALRNFFAVHFCGAVLISSKEIQERFEKFRDTMKTQEIAQAERLNEKTDLFKRPYFLQILRELRQKQKNIIILRTRCHSRVEQSISPEIRKDFDRFLSDSCQEYSLTFIDMNKDLSVNDSDFWDYTHFNETGAKKIMTYLTARLQNAPKK